MIAFIPAAGLGTRLKPYTLTKPKALVEIGGKSLLELAITKLKRFGYTRFVVNIHHFADQIIDALAKNDNFGMEIFISDERNGLLDTGGGILQAANFRLPDEEMLVYNVDVLSDINLDRFRAIHHLRETPVTLACRVRESSRQLLFDDLHLCGWTNKQTGQVRMARHLCSLQEFAFSGIHLLSPAFFPLVNEQGAFSIIDVYLRLAETHKLSYYNHSYDYWADLGKVPQLEQLQAEVSEKGFFWI